MSSSWNHTASGERKAVQQTQSVFKSHNIQLCGFPHLLCEFVVSRQRVCGRVITIYKSINLDWEPEALCSTTLEGASWRQRLSLPLLLCNLPDEERRSLEVCESLPIESSWSPLNSEFRRHVLKVLEPYLHIHQLRYGRSPI
jgi:hypothetical protein